jgi:hypothetical protein
MWFAIQPFGTAVSNKAILRPQNLWCQNVFPFTLGALNFRIPTISLVVVLLASEVNAQVAEPYRIKAVSKAIPNSRLKMVNSEAHFGSSVEATWKVVNALTDFPSFLPRVTTVESLGTSDDKERFYVLIDIPWPLPDLWNIVSVTRDNDFHQLAWEMIDGNIKKNVGNAKVESDGMGSAIKLNVTVDVGMGLPKWLVAWATKHYLPKVLVALGNRLSESKKPATPLPTATPAKN